MLNIAFVGGGGIARHHAGVLTQLKNARIVAVTDVVPAAAQSFAADFAVPDTFADYNQMLKLDHIDAVWVCTPTFLHPAPVIAAARAGKHVFCEKPMALKVADARRMDQACKRHDVRLTIGFVRRFDTEWPKLKQIVQSGAVGRPVIWRSMSSGRPGPQWFRDENKGGGPLMDGCVHNYDTALQIFGPAESVQASSMQFDATSVGADTSSAIVNFASGDQLSIVWSWGAASGARIGGLQDVLGPNGALQFSMTAATPPKSYNPDKQGAFTLQAGEGKARVYPYRRQNMFLQQAKHVVQCFDRGEQPLVTGTDGIEALKIAAAVLKSGKTRQTIKIR
jgi:predicted dehydrogenase